MKKPRAKLKRKTRHPGPCFYCQSGRAVDYKDTLHLRRFLARRGKIRSRAQTGLCAKHQRQVSRAVKRARIAALLSFVER